MKKIVTIIASIIICSSSYAQLLSFNSGGLISVQWNMASPMGETNDFVSKNTLSGISIDYRHCYKKNIIIGGRTGWVGFYENTGLTDIENGTTATYERMENKINAAPILFIVDYMVPSDKFIPYAGIGIGGYFINSSVSSDIIGSQNTNSFHFGVSPEVGITIPFIISNFGLNISTRYNFVVKSSKTTNFSWFDFNIGLSFMY